MFSSIGPMEWAIIFVIVLIVFGPKSLPKLGQSLGRGIREFKDATRGITDDLTGPDDDEADRRARAARQRALADDRDRRSAAVLPTEAVEPAEAPHVRQHRSPDASSTAGDRHL